MVASTEILIDTYRLTQRKVCHAHFNAHKLQNFYDRELGFQIYIP